ncbi:MAG TPA: pas/pac sensor protein [Microscillaceae bacterium]|jgi:PAS domain S-box-containing protein|nr:pas/pac sensor protein [Microscillaceae bacterium]
MFKIRNLKIGIKVTLLVVVIVLISVFSISYLAYRLNRDSFEEKYLEALNVVGNLKLQKIETFFERLASNIKFASQFKPVTQRLTFETKRIRATAAAEVDSAKLKIEVEKNKEEKAKNEVKKEEKKEIKKDEKKENNAVSKELELDSFFDLATNEQDLTEFFRDIQKNYRISNIHLTDKDGKIILTTSSKSKGVYFQDPDGNIVSIGRDSVYFSNVFKGDKSHYLLSYAPIYDNLSGKPLGVMIFEVNMSSIFDLVTDTTGLGQTGEIILVKSIGNRIVYINPLRVDKNAANKFANADISSNSFLFRAVKGGEGATYDVDYRNKQVLAVWRYIKYVDWGIIVKMDVQEIFAPTQRLAVVFLTAGAVVILIALIIGLVFSRLLINPLLLLQETIELLSKGILPRNIEGFGNDEIGQMTQQINKLSENLRSTADFARGIGEGNFEADFKPASKEDTLGLTLMSMRDSIQQAYKREEEGNWIITGRAEIGDILGNTTNIEELGEYVIEYVTKKINAVQGAFYTLNNFDEQDRNAIIEMNASFAYNKRKYLKAKFKASEGLVGQAVVEKDSILRTEIPDEYVTITSGLLGDRKPKSLLIVPLQTSVAAGGELTVLGVMEFAGFEKFTPREVKFVEEISDIVARRVFNIKVQENTQKLLEESQTLGKELTVQQEVLRQNAEVMEATQQQLRITNEELKFQIEEVRRANDKTQLLLRNASEIITIYKEDGTISYISPAVETILGYLVEEMVGTRDIKNILSEGGKEAFEDMFKQLKEDPEEKITIQFSYQTKRGDSIWLEATGTNLLDDPAIQGFLVNTRDITVRRLAEEEQRKRGQMQALSENSPDLIVRVGRQGTIFYINPTIEQYTRRAKDFYIQKRLNEIGLDDKVIGTWNEVISRAARYGEKISIEMDFVDAESHTKIMQVNAIPEKNEDQEIESVLLVSHDITERKQIELDIQFKNRKITESINYAKRIQEAILPDTNQIQRFISNSFILYKPRDVVSGDFPWFAQKAESVFIAVVDCTGHGVPGALISLVGYFLLNNIINLQGVDEPGIILDLLDQAVIRTLKQDEVAANTKDGMDIALCKINPRENTAEYAGAHRPLFYITQNGDFHEIKGDKFPIGGGQYKNRTYFSNNLINFQPGDSFFMFSDGFPDQFGGDENKKFSQKKIKELLLQNLNLDMIEINRILDVEFENWKGDGKQTDDVLMVGMRV